MCFFLVSEITIAEGAMGASCLCEIRDLGFLMLESVNAPRGDLDGAK
jgi:hypothetical protein